MTVIYIRADSEGSLMRVGVRCDTEKREYLITESALLELGDISVGDNLTREMLSALEYSDSLIRAKRRALNILSYGDNSEKTLMMKLLRAGIKREIAEETVLFVKSHGYINAERQIVRLVENEIRLHHSGPRKLIPKLAAKGYARSDIERVLGELIENGDIDFDEEKRKLIESHRIAPSDTEQIKKLLYKNGYNIC